MDERLCLAHSDLIAWCSCLDFFCFELSIWVG